MTVTQRLYYWRNLQRFLPAFSKEVGHISSSHNCWFHRMSHTQAGSLNGVPLSVFSHSPFLLPAGAQCCSEVAMLLTIENWGHYGAVVIQHTMKQCDLSIASPLCLSFSDHDSPVPRTDSSAEEGAAGYCSEDSSSRKRHPCSWWVHRYARITLLIYFQVLHARDITYLAHISF